jgi:hypothetical protein
MSNAIQSRKLHEHRLKHKAVASFTAGTKKEYWWLFLVEIALSFVFIALLGILAPLFLELQISLSLLMGTVQLFVPAFLQPYQSKHDTHNAVVASLTYIMLQLAGLTTYFVHLNAQVSSADASIEELQSRIKLVDDIFSAIFLVGIFFLLGTFVMTLVPAVRDLLCKRKAKSKSRVVPIPSANSAPAAKGRKGGTVEVTGPGAMLPVSIFRPSAGVLARVPPKELAAYIAAFRHLHELHSNIMVVSIQAMVRGKSSRNFAERNMGEITRAWGADAGDTKLGMLPGQMQQHVSVRTVRRQNKNKSQSVAAAENNSTVVTSVTVRAGGSAGRAGQRAHRPVRVVDLDGDGVVSKEEAEVARAAINAEYQVEVAAAERQLEQEHDAEEAKLQRRLEKKRRSIARRKSQSQAVMDDRRKTSL